MLQLIQGKIIWMNEGLHICIGRPIMDKHVISGPVGLQERTSNAICPMLKRKNAYQIVNTKKGDSLIKMISLRKFQVWYAVHAQYRCFIFKVFMTLRNRTNDITSHQQISFCTFT